MKNTAKLTILFLFLLFTSFLYANSSFYFYAEKEGVYKFKIPDKLKETNIYFTYEKASYIVYKEGAFGYLYCPMAGYYQLTNTVKSDRSNFKIARPEVLKDRNYYKYALPGSLNSSHWFLFMLSEDKPYKKELSIGVSENSEKEHLKLSLYNFSKSSNPVTIKIDGEENTFNIPSGKQIVKIPFVNKNDRIFLEVLSYFNEVGIEYIEMNTSRDKKVLGQHKFEKYTFTKEKSINVLKDEYAYGTFINNTFLKVKKGMLVKNLILQKTSEIKELVLKSATYPNEEKKDFLVLYNAQFFKYEQLNPLKKLLKKINPGLDYTYIPVQKIYNKYSFSDPSAKAIKKYLHQVKPRYVLLLGDASEKGNNGDFIPTFYYLQDQDFTRIETDYSYCYLEDPANPQFALGRLPFNSYKDLKTYITKTNTYLLKKQSKDYVIYDDISVLTPTENVEYTTYKQQNILKKTFGLQTIPDFINDKKPAIFQFTGHASSTGWSNHKKVTIDAMKDISPGNLFFLIDLSCWTGTYAYHKRDCFVESLLKLTNKGAVSAICASGYTVIDNYNYITNFLLENRGKSIGNTINSLKKTLFNKQQLSMDDMHAYNLLGIPTLKL